MRRRLAVAIVAVVAATVLTTPSIRGHADEGAAAAPVEGDRPHAGFVPGRDGGPFWTRVVDASTGAPVAGATLVRHEESPWEGDLDHAAVLGAATSDARGIALVPRDDSEDDAKPADGHWVVRAPGYATACEYGSHPPVSVVLHRGEAVTIRVLDPFGCPAVGAKVEWADGCSHSPALAEGVTDDEGLVRLADVDPRRGDVWVEAASGGLLAPADLEGLVGHGERMPTIVLHHGPTPRGIVVDPAGRPVRGAVLRSQEVGRGPVGISGADGRFRLAAIPAAATLWVRPFWMRADRVPALDDVDLSAPLRIVLTPNGLVPRTWAGARVRIVVPRSRSAEEDSGYVSIRSDDGSVETVECAPVEGRPDELIGTLDVAPGRVHTVLVDEEAADAFVAAPFVATPGAEVTVIVRRVPRATLRITGEVPRGAGIVLVPGSANRRLEDADSPIHLPPTARAMLRVDDALGLVRLFEVGEADAAGVRTVKVRFPAPHAVRWSPGVDVKSVELRRGRRELRIDTEDGGLRTHATGACELVVTLRGEEGVRRVPIRLPDEGPVVLEVDPRATPVTEVPDRGSYRVVWPKESSGGGGISASSGPGGGSWSMGGGDVSASIGSRIVVWIPGFVTHRIVVTRAETRDIEWGTCSVDLGVFDAEGATTDARLVLDDEPYDVSGGRLTLAGLAPGWHRLLVIAADEDEGGREVRIDLKEGERRPLRVVLAD